MVAAHRAASATTANSTTISITIPASAAEGDYAMIWWVTSDASTLTNPAGWTQLQEIFNGNQRTRVLGRLMDADDFSDVVSLLASSQNKMTAIIEVVSGVDPTTPISQTGTPVAVNAAGTTRTNPTLTLTEEQFLVAVVTSRGNTTLSNWTAPSGWTRQDQAFNSGSGETSGAIATRTMSAGAAGGDNWTSDVSDLRGTTFLYAFAESGGGGGGTIVKTWNGTDWVNLTAWNGTAWADAQTQI